MRVDEVAQAWSISKRQVYRLIKDGTLPATRKPRDRPVVGYEVDTGLVAKVKTRLDTMDVVKVGAVKRILQGGL